MTTKPYPAEVAVRGGRAIKPFPLRTLVEHLTTINLRHQILHTETLRLLSAPPWEPVPYRQQLGWIIDTLDGIEEACQTARSHCNDLWVNADHDHATAQRAALAILKATP